MGILELGLDDDSFWNLSPAQFYALNKYRSEMVKREDIRFGVIASFLDVILGAFSKNHKPKDAFEIMGHRKKQRKVLPGQAELMARIAEAQSKRMKN